MATPRQTTVEQTPDAVPAEAADLGLVAVMGSVLAAGFGVQSKENKVRDFTRGRPAQFIIAGLIFTAVLLLGLVAVVTLVV